MSEWKQVVREFLTDITPIDGLFSVKDLCDYLLRNSSLWKNSDEVIKYLRAYLKVSKEKRSFHSLAADFDKKMISLYNYDVTEIRFVTELINKLEK